MSSSSQRASPGILNSTPPKVKTKNSMSLVYSRLYSIPLLKRLYQINHFNFPSLGPIEPVIQEPVDPCSPSPCGPYSDCRVRNGNVAGCTCKPGFVGAPPNCRPECLINPDCSSDRACIQEKCRDPCPGTCASNANCQVISHRPTCTCPSGTRGDPYSTGCSPIPPCK